MDDHHRVRREQGRGERRAAGAAAQPQARRREQPADRDHQQRPVGDQADRALLGEHRDRLGVALQREALAGAEALAELVGEAARAGPEDGRVGADLDAAVDQSAAPLRLGGQPAAADQGQRGRERQDAGGAGGDSGGDPPPGRGEDEHAADQGDRARLREGDDQGRQQHDEDGAGGEQLPAAAAVGDHGGERGHRHRQVAAEDVRVPEERVDPEVGMGLVARDHLVVPEQLPGRVLEAGDGGEGEALRGEDDHDRPQQPGVPLDGREQVEERRERDEEEADVLDRLREVVRVARLQPVEDEHRGEGGAGPAQPARGRSGRRSLRGRGRAARRAPPRRSARRAAAAGWSPRRRGRPGSGTAAPRRAPARAGTGGGGSPAPGRRAPRRRPAGRRRSAAGCRAGRRGARCPSCRPRSAPGRAGAPRRARPAGSAGRAGAGPRRRRACRRRPRARAGARPSGFLRRDPDPPRRQDVAVLLAEDHAQRVEARLDRLAVVARARPR